MKLELVPIENIPIIKKNDNIGKIIVEKDQDICDNDIYVIASTIISKSQGRLFNLKDINPKEKSIIISKKNGKDPRFVEAVLSESSEVLITDPFLLVKTNIGNICVNSGIDYSNVGNDNYIYLPLNPDLEAKKIGCYIYNTLHKNISVIITDTNGRPFRNGQTGVSIGVYGINPIYSWIGKKDLFGYTLKVSEQAIVDEIACAANIIMGEGNRGYPIIKLRGLKLYTKDNVSIDSIYRNKNKDIIFNNLKNKN